MKKEKGIYAIGCGLGGVLIGLFAGKLNTGMGAAMFSAGVIMLVFSAVKFGEKKE